MKKDKIRGLKLHNFKTNYKTTVTKTMWYYHKARHIAQWNRIKSPEINLYIYSQLILEKVPRPFEEKKIVSTNGAGTIEEPHAK